MHSKIQLLIQTLQKKPRRLFLIDGLGALLTLFFLAIVLVTFQEYIGMPVKTLYALSAIVVIFIIYSFSCYFLTPNKWHVFLKVIALANLSYCIITLGCIYYFYESLTLLGLIYFIPEILIIVVLVALELKVANKY